VSSRAPRNVRRLGLSRRLGLAALRDALALRPRAYRLGLSWVSAHVCLEPRRALASPVVLASMRTSLAYYVGLRWPFAAFLKLKLAPTLGLLASS